MNYMVKLSPSGTFEQVDYSWEEAGNFVGGWIQVCNTNIKVKDKQILMLVNEEGKLKGLETNHIATLVYTYNIPVITDIIVGGVVFATYGFINNEPDITGLTKSEAQLLFDKLKEIRL